MLSKKDLDQIDERIAKQLAKQFEEQFEKRLNARFRSYNEKKLDRKFKEISLQLKKIDKNTQTILRMVQYDYGKLFDHEVRITKLESRIKRRS